MIQPVLNPIFNASFSPWKIIKDSLFPALVVLIVLLWAFSKCLSAQLRVAGTLGFAMDDAWIHVAVARNFAAGNGWGVVPGKMLSVSTSPTWTLLLSVFFLFFSNPLKITLFCSFACMAVASVLCYLLAFRLTESRVLGVVASVLLITGPISLWGLASGLELPLSLAALMLSLYLYYEASPSSRLRTLAVPVAIAFAAVSRPELFVLIPLALADTFYSNWKSASRPFRTMGIQILVILIALSPYFVANLYSHGKIFPATYYAKTIVRGVGLSAALSTGETRFIKRSLLHHPLRQYSDLLDDLKNDNFVMLLMLSIGALAFAAPFATLTSRRGFLLPLALLIIPYAMGVSSPSQYMSNHAGRYFVIFPPLMTLLGCLGIRFLWRSLNQRFLAIAICVFALWISYRNMPATLRHIGVDAESTQRLYVEMPLWIRDNLEPGATLAVNDIGGLAYFTGRDMIDVMGLATPEIWPALWRKPREALDTWKMRAFLKEKGVKYVILSPKYYPKLTRDENTFEPIREWRETHKHGRIISPQILYRVHWSDK